ncbi:MAG: TetR/AcrR family transcriptional regulator [Desulfovibrio sp.]
MSRKETILNAATVLFATKGFADTHTSELAELTNVAEGTIFYHFKNKENLLLEILKRTRVSIVDETGKFISGRKFTDGLDMVEQVISFYLFLAGTMEQNFLLLHRHFIYKIAEENEEFREHLEAIYNCMADFFEEAIIQGQKDGSIRELHPRKTALLLYTMVDGLVRFKSFNLYDAGALFNDLIESCRRLLQNQN